MKIKKALKPIIKILTLLFICSTLSNISSFLLFLNQYSVWTNRFLVIIFILLLSLGFFRLLTVKSKIMRNTFSSILLISSVFFLIKPYNLNKLNYIITVSNNYDNTKIHEDKMKLSEIGLEEFTRIVSLKKEDVEFKTKIINKFEFQEIDNFKIYYENEICKNSIPEFINIINSYTIFISDYFPIYNDSTVEIIIKDTMNSNMLGAHNYITDRIYLKSKASIDRLGEADNSRSFEGVVIHEYTHMLLSKLYKQYLPDEYYLIPQWFSEGIATYYSKLFLGLPILKESSYSGNIKDDNNFNNTMVIAEYEASEAIANYIINKGDKDFLVNLFIDLKKEKDIYTSLENILGEDFDQIQSKILLKN